MLEEVDIWLDNPFISTAAYFSVTILLLVVFLAIFELVTRYKDWQEVKRGNVAVAMAIGGKIFGICNIFHYIIPRFDSFYEALVWAFYGYGLLLLAYFIFEFLTPVWGVLLLLAAFGLREAPNFRRLWMSVCRLGES